MNIEKWIDMPSLIIGIFLLIVSIIYWDVKIQGFPVSTLTLGLAIFLIIVMPGVTLLTDSEVKNGS